MLPFPADIFIEPDVSPNDQANDRGRQVLDTRGNRWFAGEGPIQTRRWRGMSIGRYSTPDCWIG
jgi:hypothetical protein